MVVVDSYDGVFFRISRTQKMKSVGNIMKITKAMKMVAAARMRGAQTKVEACRGFVDPSLKLFGDNPCQWRGFFAGKIDNLKLVLRKYPELATKVHQAMLMTALCV